MDRVIYIAGPYRAPTVNDIYNNIVEARKRMEWAWLTGWIPICPHTNSALIDGLVTDDIILTGYLHILTRCDAILLGNWGVGWKNSAGAVVEHQQAIRLGLKVLSDPLSPQNEGEHEPL